MSDSKSFKPALAFYANPNEPEVDIACYESVLNDCIKRLGGRFTLSDLYNEYKNYEPKYTSKPFTSMTPAEVSVFAKIFYFNLNSKDISSLIRQLSNFVKRNPQFYNESLMVVYHRMVAVLRKFREDHPEYGEINIYINTIPMFSLRSTNQPAPAYPEDPTANEESPDDEDFISQIMEGLNN